MAEEDVGDGDLGQGFDGRGEEAGEDGFGDPLPVALGVGTPEGEGDGGGGGDEVCCSFAVLQGEGLPEEEAPAGEEELKTTSCWQDS